MNEYETVIFEVDDAIATIKINRPEKMNSFDTRLRAELLQVVQRVNSDTQIKVAILTGNGRAFSAGADLTAATDDEEWSVLTEINEEYKPILMAIHESEKLYIAAVNGAAAGAGSAFALVSDLCVMADNAFLLEAFAAIGLVPDCGASWYLTRQLGPKVALELILSGERISAQRCLELGLANRVVPADELLAEARKLADLMASKAPLAVKYSKKLVAEVADMSLGDTIRLEAKYQDLLAKTDDVTEGVNAFLEKRTPNFTGK